VVLEPSDLVWFHISSFRGNPQFPLLPQLLVRVALSDAIAIANPEKCFFPAKPEVHI
jgi:hypothetical protein